MVLLEVNLTELIINKLTLLLTLCITAFAIIKSVEVFAKERSVGSAALGKLVADLVKANEHTAKLEVKVEKMQENHSELKEDVKVINKELKDLLQNTINFFSNNKR